MRQVKARDITDKSIRKYSKEFEDKDCSITPEEMDDLIFQVEEFNKFCGIDRTLNCTRLSNLFINRLKKDLDMYVNVEGMRGFGKSNLVVLLNLLHNRYAGIWRNTTNGKMYKILPRTTHPGKEFVRLSVDFNFQKNISFLDDVDTLKKKFNEISQYSTLAIDEGSKNLHRQNWQTKVQFMLVSMSDTERYQNKCVYICFPNFKELNSVFRNDRIGVRLYVYARNKSAGYSSCIMSVKDNNRFIADPWHLEENAKLFNHQLKKVTMTQRTGEQILRAEKRLLGYAGNFHVPALEIIAPRLWKVYKRLKIENAQRELSNTSVRDPKNVTKYKLAIKMLMAFLKENRDDIKLKDIAKLTNIGESTLKEIWNLEPEVKKKFNEPSTSDANEDTSDSNSPDEYVSISDSPKEYLSKEEENRFNT